MDVWNEINDTLAIVGWPLVVFAGLWLYRDSLRSLLDRIRTAEVFGQRVEIAERYAAKVSEDFYERARPAVVADAAAPTVPVPPRPTAPVGQRPADSPDRDPLPPLGGHPTDPAGPPGWSGHGNAGFTRDQVETFIKAAAEAGYDIGSIGTRYPIKPVIRWTDENVPEIDSWFNTRHEVRSRPIDSTR